MRAVLLLLLLASRAGAHPLAPALLEITETGGGLASVRWKTSVLGVPDAPMRPVLPERCATRSAREEVREGEGLVARWQVDCGADGLIGATLAVDGLGPARTQALVRLQLADGRVLQTVLRPAEPSYVVPVRPGRLDVLRAYGRLGVEHVLTGADHLLFVLGLLILVPSFRPLVRTVTAFTVGHSITLSIAALGLAPIPQQPAEVLIALTVLALAAELARPPKPTLLRRRPWLLALLCGLVHGLGFAGALREVGLPAGEVPVALFSFNAGIEVGQLAFVTVVLAVGAVTRGLRARLPAPARLVPVYVMGSLAAFWCFERVAAVLR